MRGSLWANPIALFILLKLVADSAAATPASLSSPKNCNLQGTLVTVTYAESMCQYFEPRPPATGRILRNPSVNRGSWFFSFSNQFNETTVVRGSATNADGSVSILTPIQSLPGLVNYTMFLNSSKCFPDSVAPQMQYSLRYFAIFRMEPNSGPFTGNTAVMLILAEYEGSSFPLVCKFTSIYNNTHFFLISATETSSSRVQCVTPAVEVPKFAYTYLELSVDGGLTYTNEKKIYSFISTPAVTSISLATGPFAGNTLVTVTGSNFLLTANLRCNFGERAAVASFLSSTSIICVSPLVRAYPTLDGKVLVSVTTNGQQFAENSSVIFTYYPNPIISNIAPIAGPKLGQSITISGKNFVTLASSLPYTFCRFISTTSSGVVTVPATVLDSTKTVCSVPASVGVDFNVSLAITFNNQQFHASPVQYFVYSLTSIRPNVCVTTASAIVEAIGLGLGNRNTSHQGAIYQCHFGSVITPATFNRNTSSVFCSTPPLMPIGSVPFHLSLFPSQQNSENFQFTFVPELSVASVTPKSGPRSGKFVASVTGANFFDSGYTACKFFYLDAKSPVLFDYSPIVVNSTLVLCFVPALPKSGTFYIALSVDRQLYSATVGSIIAFELLTYSPQGGLIFGGTNVTVTVSAATDRCYCRFGRSCNVTNGVDPCVVEGLVVSTTSSSSKIICSSPPLHSRNAATTAKIEFLDVALDRDGFSLQNDTTYLYYAHPNVTSFQPPTAPVTPLTPTRGNKVVIDRVTSLTITGVGFHSALGQNGMIYCKYGNALSIATIIDAGSVKCRAPNMDKPLSVPVYLSFNEQDFSLLRIQFVYHTINSIQPTAGPNVGGTYVSIKGVNLDFLSDSSWLQCRWDLDIVVRASWVPSQKSIVCLSPKKPEDISGDDIKVEITLDSRVPGSFTDVGLYFTYFGIPLISTVTPRFYTRRGGELVSIAGFNFFNSSLSRCRFGSAGDTLVDYVKPTLVYCVAPPSNISISYKMCFSNNGVDFQCSDSALSTIFYFKVLSVFPDAAPADDDPSFSRSQLVMTSLNSDQSDRVAFGFFEFNSQTVENRVFAIYVRKVGMTVDMKLQDNQNISTVDLKPGVDIKEYRVELALNQDKAGTFMYTNDLVPFYFYRNVSISSLYPTAGSISGGTTVLITGYNFVPSQMIRCRFGSGVVTAVYISLNRVRCDTPSTNATGVVEVALSMNVGAPGSYLATKLQFLFLPKPVINAVTPQRAPGGYAAQPVPILIIGQFSLTDEMGCRFQKIIKPFNNADGDPIDVIGEYLTPTQMRCFPPSVSFHDAVFAVLVSIDRQNYIGTSSSDAQVVYYDIMTVSPLQVEIALSQNLTISGYNFYKGVTACRFSLHFNMSITITSPATVVKESSSGSFVSCLVPISSPLLRLGLWHVDVGDPPTWTNSSNRDYRLTAITVIPDLDVISIQPNSGRLQGGVLVTVYGTAFQKTSNLACRFGTLVSTNVTYISSTLMTCVTPASARTGIVPFYVSVSPDRWVSNSSVVFLYNAVPIVKSILPIQVTPRGGSIITLVGDNFASVPDSMRCGFNCSTVSNSVSCAVYTPATLSSPSSIICASPAFPQSYQSVQMSLTIDGINYSKQRPLLLYGILRADPPYGPVTGNTTIKLTGYNLQNANDTRGVYCMFYWGEFNVTKIFPALYDPLNGFVQCQTPPATRNSSETVRVYVGLSQYEAPTLTTLNFTFYGIPTVRAVTPRLASTSGLSNVTIFGTGFLDHDLARCKFTYYDVETTVAIYINSTTMVCRAPRVCFTEMVQPGCPIKTKLRTFLPKFDTQFRVSLSLNNQQYTEESQGPELFIYSLFQLTPRSSDKAGGASVTLIGTNYNKQIPSVVPKIRLWGTRLLPLRSVVVGNGTFLVLDSTLPSSDAVVSAELCMSVDGDCTNDGYKLSYTGSYPVITLVPFSGSTKNPMALINGVMQYPYVSLIFDKSQLQIGYFFEDFTNEGYIGKNNIGHVKCSFGSTKTTLGTVISKSEMRCSIPDNPPAIVQVSASLNGQQYYASSASFYFYSPQRTVPSGIEYGACDVDSSTSSVHPVTALSIYGLNFVWNPLFLPKNAWNSPVCRFGTNVFNYTMGTFLNTTSSVLCLTPDYITELEGANLSNATIQVEVALNGRDFSAAGMMVRSFQKPCIDNLDPPIGPANGGQIVTINGHGFRGDTGGPWCMFGDSIPQLGTFISYSQIACMSPALPNNKRVNIEGVPFPLRVSLNGQSYTTPRKSESNYYYFIITGFSPALAPMTSSTQITILGSNIVKLLAASSPYFMCRFGTNLYTTGNFVKSTATCPTPVVSSPMKTVLEIAVATSFSPYSQDSIPFFLHGEIGLDRIYPRSGPTGTGADGLPGTVIKAYGKNFFNRIELQCGFEIQKGYYVFAPSRYLSPTVVECEVPSSPSPGLVGFTLNTGNLNIEMAKFYYYSPPQLSVEPQPKALQSRGGTTLRLNGVPMTVDSSLINVQCRLNDTFKFPGIVINEDYVGTYGRPHVKCITPPGLTPGLYEVSASFNDGTRACDWTNTKDLMVYEAIHISNVFPSVAWYNTSIYTVVSVIGKNFLPKDLKNREGTEYGIFCLFNGTQATATFVSDTLIVVTPPALPNLKVTTSVPLECSLTPQDVTDSGLMFTYAVYDRVHNCPLDCNNNGRCISEKQWDPDLDIEEVRGVCVCNEPFRGFDCSDFISISDYNPASGPQEGGTMVTIEGYRLNEGLNHTCKFGYQLVPATVVPDAATVSLMCQSPPYMYNGSVAVEVSVDGTHWTASNSQFSYYQAPIIHTPEPPLGPTSGGTVITFRANMNHTLPAPPYNNEACYLSQNCRYLSFLRNRGLTCIFSFGSQNLTSPANTYSFPSTSTVECVAPSFVGFDVTNSFVHLQLSLNGQNLVETHNTFFVYEISRNIGGLSLWPSVGLLGGGTVVQVFGAGFVDAPSLSRCSFDKATPFHSWSSQRFNITKSATGKDIVLCTSPELPVSEAEDYYQLYILLNGQQSFLVGQFQFVRPWTIGNLSPDLGPSTGGTSVIVSGDGFKQVDSLRCWFGPYESKTVRRISDSQVECVSPNITLPRPWFVKTEAECLHSGFFYQGTKRSLCIPSNFECSWVYHDSSTLALHCVQVGTSSTLVIMPPRTPFDLAPTGYVLHPDLPLRVVVNVMISLDDGQTKVSSLPREYAFYETANVTGIHPEVALLNTTMPITTVYGEGFQDTSLLKCRFEHFNKTVNATFVSPFEILCKTPDLPYSFWQNSTLLNISSRVDVTINGQQFSPSDTYFWYCVSWSVNSISPNKIPTSGDILITVTGPLFRNVSGLNCKFGDDLATEVIYVNATTILCRAPSVAENKIVNVEVTLDDVHYSNSSKSLVFTALEQFMMFGRNDYCQLAFPDAQDRLYPDFPSIPNSQKATDVALGQQHILAVAVETKNVQGHTTPIPGRLWVAGDNRFGQLGTGDKDSRLNAVILSTCIKWDLSVFPQVCSQTFYDLTIVKVATGMFHSFALTSTGEVYSWGWNNHQQLGLQGVLDAPNSEFPIVIWSLRNAGIKIVAIAGGQAHSAAISDKGDLYTWGQNDNGQLGTGDFLSRGTPTKVSVGEGDSKYVVEVKCGLYHTVARTSVGQVWVMGSNLRGQLGLCKDLPTRNYLGVLECENVLHTYDKSTVVTINVPTQVRMLEDLNIVSVGAGSLHTLAIASTGDLYAWGDSRYSQLGLVSLAGTQLLPALVRGLRTQSSVCTGIRVDGEMCISPTEFSQRGVTVLSVAGGDQHTILTVNRRRPWGADGAFVEVPRTFVVGDNSYGQLGLGNRLAVEDFVTITGAVENIAVKGLSAAFTQSSIIIKCLPLDGESCSGHGSCSKSGICYCLDGYRGADCSMECRGGHSNICSGMGSEALYPKIARYRKYVVSSLHGGKMYDLMLKIMGTAGTGDISRLEVSRSAFAASLISILPNSTALWYVVADMLGSEYFSCEVPPCAPYGEEIPFTPPYTTGLAWQFTTRNIFLQSDVISALSFMQSHANADDLLPRLFGVRFDDASSAIRNFNRECLSCDWSEAAFDTNILVTPIGYPDLSAYVAWSDISNSGNMSATYGISVPAIEEFRTTVSDTCLASCTTLPAVGGCMGDGTCLCKPGHTGLACDLSCPGGFSNPCSMNGRCTANATCTCDSGWRGTDCSLECPGGHDNPCNGHGSCDDNAVCHCYPESGYMGVDCSRTCVRGIDNLLCSGPKRGTCSELGMCVCAVGWRGAACSIECNGGVDADGNECSGHGSCLSTPMPSLGLSVGDCMCDLGYRAGNCSRECDGGALTPCANHGICTSSGTCDCSPSVDNADRGWRGKNCSLPCTAGILKNTSVVYSDPVIPNHLSTAWMLEVTRVCSGNGICSASDTSCVCAPGFRLSDCSRECNGGHLTPCTNQGECLATGECKCLEVRRGKACELLCPGGFPVCNGKGICDEYARCICAFMYEGSECERFATWLLAVIIVSTILFALCIAYTARRAYVLHRRRKRRRRRKVRKEEKNRIVRVAKGGRITEYSVVSPKGSEMTEIGIDLTGDSGLGVEALPDALPEIQSQNTGRPATEIFGAVRAIAKLKLFGKKNETYAPVATNKVQPSKNSSDSSSSSDDEIGAGSRAPVIEMQLQPVGIIDSSSSSDSDSDYH